VNHKNFAINVHAPMTGVTPPQPGLAPVSGKALIARFDGGDMSSHGGWLALCEIEAWFGEGRALRRLPSGSAHDGTYSARPCRDAAPSPDDNRDRLISFFLWR
jgi:hypothetical protein